MKDKFPKEGHLHIYGQPEWHDEVFIVGSTDALKGLRDAIDKAIADGQGSTLSFVNDGEGFYTHIARIDSVIQFDTLIVPYTAEVASKQNSKGAIEPTDLYGIQKAINDAFYTRNPDAK